MKTVRTLTLAECLARLHLSKDASLEDLKRAYRRRAFELHPDLNPDNKNAHIEFQQLNEAYVALSSMLQPAKETTETKQDKSARASSQGSRANSAQQVHTEQEEHTTQDTRQRQRAHAYKRADVLRDLLNDPFARRVFADIYSELNKKEQEDTQQDAQTSTAQSAASQQVPPTPPPKSKPQPRKIPFEWGDTKLRAASGLKGVVAGWLKGQIDDAQTMRLPASMLQAGIRIRLQIRRAFAAEPSTVELTLPSDFVPGKPLRLRGMGKKIGPWQGDLYLTLESN